MFDRGTERNGKIIWRAIGFGAVKLAAHRTSIKKIIRKLMSRRLMLKKYFALAKEMAAREMA